jgi:hypothetical protein
MGGGAEFLEDDLRPGGEFFQAGNTNRDVFLLSENRVAGAVL